MSGGFKKLEKFAKDPATIGTAFGGVTGGLFGKKKDKASELAATDEGQVVLMAGGAVVGGVVGGPAGAAAGMAAGQADSGIARANESRKDAKNELT